MSKMAQNCDAFNYCSISISTDKMAAFGVIQSHDILGHMVKCNFVIGSIWYWTYYMISKIPTMRTFKVHIDK